MLTVTEEAIDLLAEILNDNSVGEQQGLRLVPNDTGQFGLAIDEEQDGDHVVRKGERPILLVGRAIADALDGASIGTAESPSGPRLNLTMTPKEE